MTARNWPWPISQLGNALPGRERDTSKEHLSHVELNRIYTQIADTAVQLVSLRFPSIGRIYQHTENVFEIGPFVNPDGSTYGLFSTSKEFYTYLVENHASKMAAVTNRATSEINRDNFASHIYRTAAGTVLTDVGPFGLIHGDHGTHNLLFDDNLTLTAVLDWESAQSAPVFACCDWPALVQIRWPRYDKYWPGILEKLLERQRIFREGVKIAEQKWSSNLTKFEGKSMFDIVGSELAIVSQILQDLDCDPCYDGYDGRKVFECLFRDSSFESMKNAFEQE